MWKSVVTYALSSSNYSLANMNNMYNFIISILDIINDEEKQQLIDSLILHMGKTFYKGFRSYLIEKLPNSSHISLLRLV
jgi:hypothetical protein